MINLCKDVNKDNVHLIKVIQWLLWDRIQHNDTQY